MGSAANIRINKPAKTDNINLIGGIFPELAFYDMGFEVPNLKFKISTEIN